jgi:hypothetical protein
MSDRAPYFDLHGTETPDPAMTVHRGNEYVNNPGSSANPKADFKAHYGNQHVPRPTNAAAKRVDHAKVMGQVLRAK